MKNLVDILNESVLDDHFYFGEDDDVVILHPDELESLLKLIKGKEKKGLCLRCQADDTNETRNISYCFDDERKGNWTKWPWKKI